MQRTLLCPLHFRFFIFHSSFQRFFIIYKDLSFLDSAVLVAYYLDIYTAFGWMCYWDSAEGVIANVVNFINVRSIWRVDSVWNVVQSILPVQIGQAVSYPVFQTLKRVNLRITYVGAHTRNLLSSLPQASLKLANIAGTIRCR